jgi:hypothetical protein
MKKACETYGASLKQTHICIMGILEDEEKENDIESLFQNIIT